jgi:aspartate/methionine/tyrosine aminotransferase
MGLTDFRQVICDATAKSRGFKPSMNQVLVTPGANIITYLAIRCLVDEGGEVLIPDPGFPTYNSVIKFCGVRAVRVPLKEENGFSMDPADVEALITQKTRLIIINSPQNPTGSVMTPEELDKMYDIAEKHDIYLYSDEVYSRMIFDNDLKFGSPSHKDGCMKRTILVNGFSKAFAMTGWRLGVAIGPEEVIEKMGLLLQTTISCVSPFIQRAGIEAINGDQSAVVKMKEEYRSRRDLLVNELNSIPGISCLKPGGAFYVFPNITGTGMTSEEFAEFALEKAGVALLPGNNFGEFGQGYIRLCYATSKENIIEGILRLKNALKALN